MNERLSYRFGNSVGIRSRQLARLIAIGALAAFISQPTTAGAAETNGTIEAPQVRQAPAPGKARIVIDDLESGAGFEKITLTAGKAAVVELPKDARDILVANPAIADARVRTPRQIYIIGAATGVTTALFYDDQGKQILNLEITVALDLSAVMAALRQNLPDNDLLVKPLGGNLTVSGRVPNLAASNRAISIARRFVAADENIVNLLTIEGDDQVMLKVKIAEMRRSVSKQLGLDIAGTLDRGGNSAFAFAKPNIFGVAGAFEGGLTASGAKVTQDGSFTGILEAMERDGLVKTLAEPNLTAVSGEAARFLAGGEFPVPVGRDRDGNITIEFKQFGVGLGFTPVVLSDGRISIRMSTEVSQLAGESGITIGGLTIPGISVRRAETTVELASGGSLVIGGLLQNDIRKSIDGIPGLKEIPILGILFRSNDFLNEETELVIIVTPYLVNAVAEDKLRLPTDGFAPASDFDTYLLGRMSGIYKRQPAANVSLQGPYGYILE